jgi:hypothetical protein
MEFGSRNSAKNNKAYIKINNNNFEKSDYEDIKKECSVNGLYLIRFAIGGDLLYSSIKAVKIKINLNLNLFIIKYNVIFYLILFHL